MSGSAKLGGVRRSQWASKSQSEEEIVQPRAVGNHSEPELSEAMPVEENTEHDIVISPGNEDSENFDQPTIEPPKLQTPIKTRYGVIRERSAGSARIKIAPRSSQKEEPVFGTPSDDGNASEVTGEIPHLLPPSL